MKLKKFFKKEKLAPMLKKSLQVSAKGLKVTGKLTVKATRRMAPHVKLALEKAGQQLAEAIREREIDVLVEQYYSEDPLIRAKARIKLKKRYPEIYEALRGD